MDIEFPEIEISPLSGPVTLNGHTAEVGIRRFKDIMKFWVLEVMTPTGGALFWDDECHDDHVAYEEFCRALHNGEVTAIFGTISAKKR